MKESLRCMLMMSNKKMLVVPYTAVAEVIGFELPTPFVKSPEWLIGQINWRGISIPVVSFDKVEGASHKDYTQSLHVAIFNRLSDTNLDFIGLVVQGVPAMHRLRAKEIELVTQTKDSFLSMEVLINQQQGFIPNIEWIEKCIAKEIKK